MKLKRWSTQAPRTLAAWQTHPGSMTASLKQMTKIGLSVDRLREGPAEAHAFIQDCFSDPSALILREVILKVDDCPFIYAQTWLSQTAFNDPQTGLSRLGTRPLGELLFSREDTRRDLIEYLELDNTDSLLQSIAKHIPSLPNTLIARRSCIHYCNYPIVIIEVFLR